GFGFSIITPSATKAVMIATPKKKRAFSMGFTQSGFGLGGILGASVLPLLGEKLGWRLAIQIAAAFILLTGLFVYRLYHEQKEIRSVLDTPEDQKGKKESFKNHFRSIFMHKSLFRMCMMGLLFGIIEGAILAHFVIFLSEDLKMSRIAAGLGLAILHLGGMFGLLGWGAFSDRLISIDRRLSLFLIGLSAGMMYLFFGLCLHYVAVSQTIIFILTFLFGFLELGWSGVYYTTVGEIAGSTKAGMSTGLALFFTRIGMLVAPPIFGLIADANGYYMYSWVIFGFIIIAISTLFLWKNE
ncbi:MAG: MFS transporter, partial [Gammaproteobacteria bacterium]|nr:MFS transporter [Gammaproteobacteria bacterium]